MPDAGLHGPTPRRRPCFSTVVESRLRLVAPRITSIRIKRFGRASIPCGCTAAHFRPAVSVLELQCAFSRCSIGLILIASFRAANVRHTRVVHFVCFVDCMFTLIGTSILTALTYMCNCTYGRKKITFRSSILRSHRVAVPLGRGQPGVRRPPGRFSRAAAPGQASYDRVLTA